MKRKKIVDVKGPSVWGPVIAKRGDHLKVYAYIGDHPKTGKPGNITFVGKWRPSVNLHLTRKDAKYLQLILDGFTAPPSESNRRLRILNKLKREGVK